MIKKMLLVTIIMVGCYFSNAQNVGSSPEYIKALTSEWKGERFPDGRPKVSDAILARLKKISIEEAWGVLKNKGFLNQFEGDWTIIQPDLSTSGGLLETKKIGDYAEEHGVAMAMHQRSNDRIFS